MQKYVECMSGKNMLRGMAYLPEIAGRGNRVPLVVILHGFTADRNENLFIHKRLAKALCAEGIASLCFDFMGSGESDGLFCEMSVLTEVADVLAILDFAKSLVFVNPDRIALHGMSQGGLVAALTAARLSEQIKALSLWAPAFCIPDMCRKGNLLGISTEGIEQKGYIDYHGDKLGKIYVDDACRINIYDEVKKYPGPIQTVHGTNDHSVPFLYSEKLKELAGEQCILIQVEGADHDFATLDFNQKRLDAAVEFLKSHLL